MKRLQWLTGLMAITVVIIVGFQVYWLKENYGREKRAMEIKAGVAFQETIQKLQAEKLKLPGIFMRTASPEEKETLLFNEAVSDTSKSLPRKKAFIKNSKYFRTSTLTRDTGQKPAYIISIREDSNGLIKTSFPRHKTDSGNGKHEIFIEQEYSGNIDLSNKRSQIVTMVNSMRARLKDSSYYDSAGGKKIMFTTRIPGAKNELLLKDKRRSNNGTDHLLRVVDDTNNHALRVLYTVDSLQDSLSIVEITNTYSAAIAKQNLQLPFTIEKDTMEEKRKKDLVAITLGFVHPTTYRLVLGNTAPFLFKKLTLPVLFSLFLAGVTIFSFLLLYRNLLRQQRLAEIKNDFISNITHELKTPIATVGVAIEALKNFNAMHDPQKTKEYLDISANELQRLSLLVDKVLKLSMFEKKEIELNKEHFDMKALTQEVLDTMKLQFEKNKAVVSFETGGNDFMIDADKLHITSVIYNLLDNALKYRNGDPAINVKLASQNDMLVLTVKDNGIGIAPEYQARIFDKFFRVPTGNKHIVKGYGLGLSYVSHVVAQHKGMINVESEINHGSTFMIKLPVHA
jgi:two-component system phosphate regulon sensor histidine kinase PhoR